MSRVKQSAPSSDAYQPPLWSALPSHPYTFTVIRDGTVVDTVDLSARPHYTVGRLPPPHTDITLDHPSLSRTHAIIQHRSDGRCYVYDSGSSHGTFVNRQRIRVNEFVEIRNGDQLRFGASTRLFVLEGPEALTPASLPVTKAPVKTLPVTDSRASDVNECDWGFNDAVAHGDISNDYDSLLMSSLSEIGRRVMSVIESLDLSSGSDGSNIQSSLSSADYDALTDAQRKLIHRLDRISTTLTNIRGESERILAKSDGVSELSEGQQNQLSKNERRLEELEEEMMQKIDQLRQSFEQSSHSSDLSARRCDGGGANDNDELDDFYDRTKPMKQANQINAPTTLSSLLLPSSITDTVTVSAEMKRCEQLRDSLQLVLIDLGKHANSSHDSEDSLDAYMTQIHDSERAKRKASVKAELRALQSHYLELRSQAKRLQAEERVRKIVGQQQQQRASHSDAATMPVSQLQQLSSATPPPASLTSSSTAAMLERIRKQQQFVKSKLVPIQDRQPAETAWRSASTTAAATVEATVTAGSPLAFTVGDTEPMKALARQIEAERQQAASKRTAQSVPIILGAPAAVTDQQPVKRQRLEAARATAEYHDASEAVWQPPVGQSGDGITELNAKYGY